MTTRIKTTLGNRIWIQSGKLRAVQVGVLLLCLAAANGQAQTFAVLTNNDGLFCGVNLATDGTSLYGMSRPMVFKMNLDGTSCTWLCSGCFNFPTPTRGGVALYGSTLYVATVEIGRAHV